MNKKEGCVERKINTYFPPSPKVEKSGVSLSSQLSVEEETEEKSCSADLSSSVLLTPETTPTKDKGKSEAVHISHVVTKLNKQCGEEIGCRDCTTGRGDNSTASPAPVRAKVSKSSNKEDNKVTSNQKKQKRQARGKSKKTNTPQRSKSASERKLDQPQSHKLTEYFPIRRSARRTLASLKKKSVKDLEDAILSGKEEGLEVIDIEGKGRGVVATKPFKRGDFVVEYAGDLIELSTAKQREDKYSQDSDIGCYMYYFNYNNKNYCVDATEESGKLGRLLNHCKSGNCKTRVVGIGNRPYLILEAAKDIKEGEELLYDYGDRSKSAIESHPWLAS